MSNTYTVDESVILAALEKDPKIFKSLHKVSDIIMSYMIRNHTKFLLTDIKADIFRFINLRLDDHKDDLKFAIDQNPYNIELLKQWLTNAIHLDSYNKSTAEELYKHAVTKNGLAIKLIDNPSKEVQLAAVTNNPDALLSITNPHIDAVKKALELKPELFKKMENITEKVERKVFYVDVDNLSDYEAEELMEKLKARQSKCNTLEGSNYLTDSMNSAAEEVDKWPEWQKKAMGVKPKEDLQMILEGTFFDGMVKDVRYHKDRMKRILTLSWLASHIYNIDSKTTTIILARLEQLIEIDIIEKNLADILYDIKTSQEYKDYLNDNDVEHLSVLVTYSLKPKYKNNSK